MGRLDNCQVTWVGCLNPYQYETRTMLAPETPRHVDIPSKTQWLGASVARESHFGIGIGPPPHAEATRIDGQFGQRRRLKLKAGYSRAKAANRHGPPRLWG
jgi:hypothetical protein